MSIGRSKEEQELTSLLAKDLVQREVMEPMSKIGWGHGTPPPPETTPAPGGPPAPAEGAPGQAAAPAAKPEAGQPAPKAEGQPASTTTPKADGPTAEQIIAEYEALRDPETGLIMRKYRTVQEALRGSGHLANMAKQAFSERDEALKQLGALQTGQLTTRQAPAASPAAAPQSDANQAALAKRAEQAQTQYDKVLSDIANNGGLVDEEAAKALSKAQRELSDAVAEVRVHETLSRSKQEETKEQAEWRGVDDYMSEHYPAAARFSEEVALHMQSDPLLTAAVNALLAQGNKIGATELAWKSFETLHGAQVAAADRAKAEDREADLAAREQVRKEITEKARLDAGVITGSPGGAGVHENRAGAPSREEIDAAKEAMRREGDAPGSPAARRFREMVIPLDPSIFGPR